MPSAISFDKPTEIWFLIVSVIFFRLKGVDQVFGSRIRCTILSESYPPSYVSFALPERAFFKSEWVLKEALTNCCPLDLEDDSTDCSILPLFLRLQQPFVLHSIFYSTCTF